MPSSSSEYTIRDCAQALIRTIERHRNDGAALQEGIRMAVGPLLDHPDLHPLGKKREANHIANSKYLYYDGQISMTLDLFPKGKKIPPHDHGIWEAIAVYSGQVHHTNYERIDDGKVEGFADLKVVDDRVLARKDVVVVMPPAEIHSFTALTDDAYVITIVDGHYKPTRHYYEVESKTYTIRDPKAWRREQVAAEGLAGGGTM